MIGNPDPVPAAPTNVQAVFATQSATAPRQTMTAADLGGHLECAIIQRHKRCDQLQRAPQRTSADPRTGIGLIDCPTSDGDVPAEATCLRPKGPMLRPPYQYWRR